MLGTKNLRRHGRNHKVGLVISLFATSTLLAQMLGTKNLKKQGMESRCNMKKNRQNEEKLSWTELFVRSFGGRVVEIDGEQHFQFFLPPFGGFR